MQKPPIPAGIRKKNKSDGETIALGAGRRIRVASAETLLPRYIFP
jgi:hypothetical protein